MKTIVLVSLIFCCACSSYLKTKRSKNIIYNQNANKIVAKKDLLKLNIFVPRKNKAPKDVLVFIHGGNWTSGNKSLYSFFGNRMAAKGIVTVVIDYTLSPKANYERMAFESAQSIKWIKENIKNYGGNPDKIIVSGHSAGGHLGALIAFDNRYFDSLQIDNPIKGVVLIDAAGLDMYTYLKENPFGKKDSYRETFSSDPKRWKAASAITHLKKGIPPVLQYLGEKTYPSLISSNNDFHKAIIKIYPETKLIIQKNKKHIPMITQFLAVRNKRYGEIIGFIKGVGRE